MANALKTLREASSSCSEQSRREWSGRTTTNWRVKRRSRRREKRMERGEWHCEGSSSERRLVHYMPHADNEAHAAVIHKLKR